jgi:hypothetical protein
VAGVVLALLAWARTGRARWYYTAVALFAAGLGNHTTIVGFAPGIVLFVLLTDRRFAMRGRTIATTGALLTAGLLQYGFIILRSHQPGAYIESPAMNVSALVRVMLARQFQDRLFAFDWHTVLANRLPDLAEHVLLPALTGPGLLLAIVGAFWFLRYRLAEGLLLLGGLLAVVAFAANTRSSTHRCS